MNTRLCFVETVDFLFLFPPFCGLSILTGITWGGMACFEAETLDLTTFWDVFHIGGCQFLQALARYKAVVTGPDLILFLSGTWKDVMARRPRSIELTVLYCGQANGAGLRSMVKSMDGWTWNEESCRHELMEWCRVPADKVDCFVEGESWTRKIHLVQLPRPPGEVVLSRAYGSSVGTYLKGGRDGSGKVVSLFPRVTFGRSCCWFPRVLSDACRRQVERLYDGWEIRETRCADVVEMALEVGASFRKVGDDLCWLLFFAPDGRVVDNKRPFLSAKRCEARDGEPQEGRAGDGGASLFPTLRACGNSFGVKYPKATWTWDIVTRPEGKGKNEDSSLFP
ncbi:hypothetical protein BJ170DRAFT_595063 [Xylariales sp. AK1849]|nr:hypothetical protein BJ170DRAFT_595063 [Xylariales sp. AK1849]